MFRVMYIGIILNNYISELINMSTIANFRINNGSRPFTVSVSHDGMPDSMLPVIAEFVSLTEKEQTIDNFYSIYLKKYSDETKSAVSMFDGGSIYADWTYEIGQVNASGIRIIEIAKTKGSYFEFSIVNPFDDLQSKLSGYVEETATEIKLAMMKLSTLGIYCDSIAIESNDDVEIHESSEVDESLAAAINKPWIVVYPSGHALGFDSEDKACAHQREHRIKISAINYIKQYSGTEKNMESEATM